jgi:hypothetical protein
MSGGCGPTASEGERSRIKTRASRALEGRVNLVAGCDISTGETRSWWSPAKRERLRCEDTCRDRTSCKVPLVWDGRLDRPVNRRCRVHGGLSTGPKTQEGRRRIAGSNGSRSSRRPDNGAAKKRGNGEAVTQQGDTP